MKKAKGEDDGGSKSLILELPEGLLQRIIYFLSQEEAVRTSILSKSWRYNWCTRPNFDFSEITFKGKKHEFLYAVDNTLQRYCHDGPPLEEFKLCISLLGGEDRHAHRESVSLLDKWVPIILTTAMGIAVKEFRLSIVSEEHDSFTAYPCLVYDLISDDLIVHSKKKIHFEHLQVLGLRKVLIKQETFDKIISSCPLLTTMSFEECRGLVAIKLDKKLHKHLKHFTFIGDLSTGRETRTIKIEDVPTLETIKIVRSRVLFHGCHQFNNLKSITLEVQSFETIESDQISIDAPNLLYFHYWGAVIPNISFAPNCTSSNISLVITSRGDGLSWFSKISRLLQALRQSEISLNIQKIYRGVLYYPIPQDRLEADFVNGGNKPVLVKHLQLRTFDLFILSHALQGLLCICHPRNITHPSFGEPQSTKEVAQKKLKEYLCTLVMMRGEGGNQELRQDLEAVRIEKRFGSKWKPIQWEALLDCPQVDLIRFRLEWSEACQPSPKLRKLVRNFQS